MADLIVGHPRLAEIYDALEPDRPDLEPYDRFVAEFAANTVLDIGCGTGTLASVLAGRGVEVIAVDPAAASLDVARSKPGADRVRWIQALLDPLWGVDDPAAGGWFPQQALQLARNANPPLGDQGSSEGGGH